MAKGTLEIDSDLPVLSYEKEGEKKYRVTFVPKKSGTHDLVVKYNGIPCAGKCDIYERPEGIFNYHIKYTGNQTAIDNSYVTHHNQMRHKSHTKVLSKWQNKEK